MIRSMHTAEQAMKRQQVRIDTLANNLANVNTTGFRQVLTRITEMNAEQPDITADGMQARNALRKTPLEPGSRDQWVQVNPLVMSQATDTRHGPITNTGRETDVAILGDGFFAVQTAAGERFTRAGSFILDDQHRLVTPDGNPVLGDGGPIVIGGEDFSIGTDGTVMVDGAAAGRLRIVDFSAPDKLQHEGNNLLKPPADMEAQERGPADVIVAQGQVEGSNVNAIDTLVAMINAQRAFEIQQKALTTEDEMLATTVSKLPRTAGA